MVQNLESLDRFISNLTFKPISKGLGITSDPNAIAKMEFDQLQNSTPKKKGDIWDPKFKPFFIDPLNTDKDLSGAFHIKNNMKQAREAGKSDFLHSKILDHRKNSLDLKKQIKISKALDQRRKHAEKNIGKFSPVSTKVLPSEKRFENLHPANPFVRLIAFWLDFIIVLGFFSVSLLVSVTYLKYSLNWDFVSLNLITPLLSADNIWFNLQTIVESKIIFLGACFGFLLILLYLTFFSIVFGTTPGKLFFNLRPVSKDGEKLTLLTVFMHLFSFIIMMPTAVFAFLNKEHQTVYDQINKVYIVKTE